MKKSRIVRLRALVSALAVLAFAGAAAGAEPVRYDGHRVVRVQIRDQADLAKIESISSDMWSHHVHVGEGADFRIPPERWAELEASGLEFRVLIDNVQRLIDAERAALAVPEGDGVVYFDNYRTRDEVSNYVNDLVALNPAIASRFSTGEDSIEGRDIFGIRISGAAPGARPGFLINSCQHAREWVSVTTTMYIADQLVRLYGTDPVVTNLVNNVEFFIIPIVNPDGYIHSWTTDRLWRKNRRNNGGSFGVDNNRNWGFEWGGQGASATPSSETYRGTAPFSEPETRSLRDFFIANPNIRATIDFHSYSQLLLSPWAYTLLPTPDAAEYLSLGTQMAAAIQARTGAVYTPGPVGSTLYLASGGSVDWTYGDRGIFSWTIELRDTGANGFVLPASQIRPTGQENFEAVKTLANWVATTPSLRLSAIEAPGVAVTGQPTPVSVQVRVLPGAALDSASPQAFYRVNSGAFSAVNLTGGAGGLFTGALPGAACGTDLGYYFQAATTGGEVARFPADAPANTLLAEVASVAEVVDDTLETNTGWTVGAPGDTATAGVWVRADPVGTSAQPEDDRTPPPGVNAYITGNGAPGGAVGAADVDNGATTLTTPTFDASGQGDAYVSFWAWYNNGASTDRFRVSISNNNGASWTALTQFDNNTGAWVKRSFRIADAIAPTSQMRLRFVAEDINPQGIVEAGVDDFEVFRLFCAGLPGDVNGDGQVNFLDLNLVLSNFGATGSGLPGDANGDGRVDFLDLNLVLSNFGQGV